MGHLINPIGFRLANKKIMDSYIPLYTKNNFREAANNIFEVNLYFKQLFSKQLFKKAGFIFSHFRLYETIKDVSLIVYLYSPDLLISNKARFMRFIKRTLYKYPAWKYRNFYKTQADEDREILPAYDFFTRHTPFKTQVFNEYLQMFPKLNDIAQKKPEWFTNKKRYLVRKFSNFYRIQQEALVDKRRISTALKLKKEICRFLKYKRLYNISPSFQKYILEELRKKPLKKIKGFANKIRVRKNDKKKNDKSKKKLSKSVEASKSPKAATKGQKLLSKQEKKVQQKKV